MKSSNSIIQSLDRGLEILDYVADARRSVSINELASILKINRSSVSRLANTLYQRGMLMHADGSREYVLGTGLWRQASQYPWIEFLSQLASASIKKLAKVTGETAHIAIREGVKTVIIDNENSTQPVSVNMNKGDEGLLHCTSVGKALILDYSRNELEVLFREHKLKSFTRNTITNLDELVIDLRFSRSNGYTIDNEEYHDGIRCVAAPVRDYRDKIIAAVGVSAPLARFPEEYTDRIGTIVKEAASNIGVKLKKNHNKAQEQKSDNPKY